MADLPGVGNRRDIMFLQTQRLPWEAHAVRGPGASRRRLSQNAATGAESFVLRLEPGYRAEAGFLGCDFEFFVVEGAVAINGIAYPPHSYGMHPAGYAHRAMTSAAGAVLVVITAGGPDRVDRGPARLAFRRDRLVVKTDTATLPWYDGVQPPVQASKPHPRDIPLADRRAPEPGVFTKVVWEDPDTKGHTFLRSDLPRLSRAPQTTRTHVVDAEYFLFEGDYIIAGEGRMVAGAYFFWAANVMHGPSACEYLSYMMGKYYGPVDLVFTKDVVPVTLDPVHAPPLPPDLRAYGAALPPPDPWS
jgi:hypothetical protein